ncbi:MAG TPA: hypothetical protein VD816_02180 [Ohtaekwangia sp.]|nr:hypothetical protein [Ohtaekwangia sp.]
MIRLRHWEYWPFGIVQFPLFFYYAWLSLRARSPVFFSAANPGIVMGGMFGESKYEVLRKIPQQYVPKTIRISLPVSPQALRSVVSEHRFAFPLICKPDLGEKGFRVSRIATESELTDYLSTTRLDFIVQELIDLPLEFGVFYARRPSDDKGKVISVVMKEMLAITGNGKDTLRDLILKNDRAKLQWKVLRDKFCAQLGEIVPAGTRVELVSIGNHARGTKFLDGSHLINDHLSSTFDTISRQIEGFYFGRFDIRCATLEDLYNGNIKVMELNGCGAEPAHIYDPQYNLLKAIKVLFIHWRTIFIIARENVRRGAHYTTWREARMYYKKFRQAVTS